MNDLGSTGDPVVRTAISVIAVTLGFGALKIGATIFAPMVLGIVAGIILAPLMDALERRGLRPGLAAGCLLILGVLTIAVIGVLVEPLIRNIAETLPGIKWEIRKIIESFRGLVQGLDVFNREVKETIGAQAAGVGEDASGASLMPSMTDTLILAPVVLAQVLVLGGTLFFFLLTRRSIYQWLSRWLGSTRDSDIILRRFTTAERLVARYFMMITVINAGLGCALGTALALIGMPGPIIWGITAALLNFILYAGPMALICALLLGGVIAFDGLMVLAPASIFLMFNMIESQFVTPALVGKHISVNPLLIFVSLVVWLWLWGPIGGIIAIPVLVIVMVMLDIFEPDNEVESAPALSPDAGE